MLLTLKPPLQNGIKSPNDFSFNSASSYYSPPSKSIGLPQALSDLGDRRMSNPHRGLPPPAAMSLPPPDRSLPAMAPLGQLPAPPQQWQGADESMRNWLQAKAEEDRRRQEEERTRQEGLRLDQRKIEQNILRESLSGGVPPVMVPLIFAGMGGGTLPNAAVEWAQHYLSQLSLQTQQQAQQQQAQHQLQQQQVQQAQHQQLQPPQPQPPPHHMSPELRRDSRVLPPNPYGGQQPLQPAPAQAGVPQVPTQGSQTPYGRPGPTSSSRLPPHPSLPRLDTGEMQGQAPAGASAQSMHAIQHGHAAQAESQQASSPSIYFHHWVPPNQQSSSNVPPTPSNKSQHSSPFSQSQQSHLRADYQTSPKKRKATGSHQAPPLPTSQPPERSPPYSQSSSAGTPPGHVSSRSHRDAGHSRQQSAGSSTRGYEAVPRPSSRQQRQEAMSGGAASGASGSVGQIGNPHSKQQTPVSSNSYSGDEGSMRTSGQFETRQSRFMASPEMRSSIPPTTTNTNREE